MVKVTHKIIRKANLRQSIRPKINRFNLRQIVRKPLGEHNANIPNIHKFSLCQRSTQNFSQYNIQNDNQNENSSIGEDYFNESNEEEEYKNDNNNISDRLRIGSARVGYPTRPDRNFGSGHTVDPTRPDLKFLKLSRRISLDLNDFTTIGFVLTRRIQ